MAGLVVDASVWVAAADATDRHADATRAFLSVVTARAVALAVPDFAELEVACALSRRMRDGDRGQALARRIIESPVVTPYPVDSSLMRRAIDTGTRRLLRGGDALYVALVEETGGELISWDEELIRRAGAITPSAWLERNAGPEVRMDIAPEGRIDPGSQGR